MSISHVSANQNEIILCDDSNGTYYEPLQSEEKTDGNLQTANMNEEIISTNNENEILTDAGSFTELEVMFQTEGSHVLDKDYEAIASDSIINLKKSIVVDGQGHYIDAKGYTGIFQADSSESNNIQVEIKNLIFKNAKGGRGAAIYIGDDPKNVNLKLINCTFIDNAATIEGGAIYIKDGFLNLTNCHFINNHAKNYGGAIYSKAKFTIDNCSFKFSLSNEGSAIYYNVHSFQKLEDIYIKNSKFELNEATGNGGAIYTSNNAYIENCEFKSNQIYKNGVSGGAIYHEGGGKIFLIHSTFTSNSVGFQSSESAKGGAVYSGSDMDIWGCNFTGNFADGHGGAIYTDKEIYWKEEDPSRFYNNSVTNGIGKHLSPNTGGAIYAGTFRNTANKLIFVNNSAEYGGAIYLNNKNEVTFDSCIFLGNKANREGYSSRGAAIYIDSTGSTVSLINNIFFSNDAVEDKAIFNCGVYGTVKNNFWGTNNPNFNDGYMVEWHRVSSNEKHADNDYLNIELLMNYPSGLEPGYEIIFKIVDKNGENFMGKLPLEDINITANKPGRYYNIVISDNKVRLLFEPEEPTVHWFSVNLHNYELLRGRFEFQEGDFAILQRYVNNADGVLNLTRNFYINEFFDTRDGIWINKPITINGNGHEIHGWGLAKLIHINASNVVLNNISFARGHSYSAGAIFIHDVNNTVISNCSFRGNMANYEGAAILIYGNHTKIINCYFKDNEIYDKDFLDGGGAAISIRGANSIIENSTFINNQAHDSYSMGYVQRDGGAILIFESGANTLINNSQFYYNHAWKLGSAIRWKAQNGTIANSIFLNNSVFACDFVKNDGDGLNFTLTVAGHYGHAISSDTDLKLFNITYWNGTVTTSNNLINSSNAYGLNITIEIKDLNDRLVKKIVLVTDENGQVKYDGADLEEGSYTFRAYHAPDHYYNEFKEITGDFNVEVSGLSPTSVNIQTLNGTSFEYERVFIDFIVENKTNVRILVTNYKGSEILYDYNASYNYFDQVLPASDEYYNITIYNLRNDTHKSSKDSILFKVTKTNASIEITEFSEEIIYDSNSSISFKGSSDCHDYNVTIYDENNNIVHSQIVNVANTYGSAILPVLDIGNYNISVTNLGNNNRAPNTASRSFKIKGYPNNFAVIVDNGVYGKATKLTVNADVDGDYTVKINSSINVTVNVVNGTGSYEIELDAGYYTANITFDNANYDNIATNASFTISRAQSNVGIDEFTNVVWNTSRSIRFTDFYITSYNVTIYNSENEIVHNEIVSSLLYNIPANLDVGTYNLTVVNLGNENIIGSQSSYLFNVVRDNNVKIIVDDVDYGREILIMVYADVDGEYTVDINGTELIIIVGNGFGVYYDLLNLNAGDYYANITFNSAYNNNITNTTFTVFEAESNLQIYEIGNVTYGKDVVVRFYDDYPTIFSIIVLDSNNTEVVNTTFEYEDKNPEMKLILADFDVGEYIVNIINLGDENVIGSGESIQFNVTELIGTISASDMLRGYNSGMDFKALLLDKNGTGIANTTITFIINGKTYTAVTDADGVAVINPKLAVGTYTVGIVNPYNDVVTTKNLKIVSRITGNKNVNTYYGKNYQYKLCIIGDDGKPVGAGIAVKVTINGKAKTLKTDKNGYITLKFTKTYLPKTYKVDASYNGFKVSNKVVVKKVLKLKKVKVKRSAKKLVLKATLKEGKKALKGKKVTFKFKGKKYKAKTNKKGIAKVTIKKKVLKKLKPGKKVKYQVTYLKNTVKRTVKVKK